MFIALIELWQVRHTFRPLSQIKMTQIIFEAPLKLFFPFFFSVWTLCQWRKLPSSRCDLTSQSKARKEKFKRSSASKNQISLYICFCFCKPQKSHLSQDISNITDAGRRRCGWGCL